MLRKLVITMIIAFLTLSDTLATGRWFRVHEDAGDGTELFADTRTAIRKGNFVEMWVLTNHEELKTGERSQVQFREFDCAKRQTRNLTSRSFSKPDGFGELLFTSDDAEGWHRLTPESAGELMWQFACAAVKKK